MKKFISIAVAVCMLLIGCTPIAMAQTEEFKVTGKVDFDLSNVTVTIDTPATYGQNIFVVLYKKGVAITSPEQYVRMGDTFADKNGKATIVFDLSSGVTSDYYIVSATGGGYMAESSHDTDEIYFETSSDLPKTLEDVSVKTGSELNSILTKLNLHFGLTVCSEFATDSDNFIKYFEKTREVEYENDFESMADVQAVANGVEMIFTTIAAKSINDIKPLYEENASILGINKLDKFYKEKNSDIYSVYLKIVSSEKKNITDLSNLRLMFEQAEGIAKINLSDAEKVTAIIKSYGEVLGIDVEEYEGYVEKYGDVEMNMDFIGRNFSLPSQVVDAYKDAVKANNPDKDDDKGSGGLSPSKPSTGPAIVIKPDTETTDKPADTDKPVTPQKGFRDVSDSHWAKSFITTLSELGVISGFEDGSFRPNDAVTREQFVKMIVEMFKLENNGEMKNFADVSVSHWAKNYIEAAVANEIISGMSDGVFGIGKELSRQDAAVIIVRTANKLGIKLEGNASIDFNDEDEFGSYAKESIDSLVKAGIINGIDGKFVPNGAITRCQCAKILCALLEAR